MKKTKVYREDRERRRVVSFHTIHHARGNKCLGSALEKTISLPRDLTMER
jgi:hypothetical protein